MELLFAMAPQQGGDGGSLISTLIMFGSIFAIFYFMIIRPQQKKAKERDALLNSLKKGDKVITASGIHGSIAGLDDATALIDVGNNTKIKMERSAISQVVSSKDKE